MHCNHFPGHIYVKKTSKQGDFGYYDSQRIKIHGNGTDTQVKSQMNDKCKVKMIKKRYIMRKNPLCRRSFLGKGGEEEKRLLNI